MGLKAALKMSVADFKTALTAASASLVFVGTVTIPPAILDYLPKSVPTVFFIVGVVGLAIKAGLDSIVGD